MALLGQLKKYREDFKDFMLVTLGTAILASSYGLFLVPNHIAPGGFSGIAFLINYVTGFPIGVLVLILNIPLLLLARGILGNKFMFKSIYGIILFTLIIDLTPFQAFTDDGFLACTYGGFAMGIGIGLVFVGRGSTGGSDMATQILHHRWPSIKEGYILGVLDALVVISAAILTGPERAMYSLITLFISVWLIGFIIEGTRRAKVFLIVTDKTEKIKASILFELKRGVTQLSATGGYTGINNNMLFCVLESTAEVLALKQIIKENDTNAFMVALDAREVLGEGFKR